VVGGWRVSLSMILPSCRKPEPVGVVPGIPSAVACLDASATPAGPACLALWAESLPLKRSSLLGIMLNERQELYPPCRASQLRRFAPLHSGKPFGIRTYKKRARKCLEIRTCGIIGLKGRLCT
jgi:hypothetical protein